MKFRTEIKIEPSPRSIRHEHRILAIGSCFAQNIGELLREHFFAVQVNPFGVLYNPLSIARALSQIIDKQELQPEDLFFHQGLWHSFSHHSVLSHPDKTQALSQMNKAILNAHNFLQKADWLLLTFGTAFVYFHLPEDKPVANCHKLPEKEFRRELLSVDNLAAPFRTLWKKLHDFNPALKIILSVSPIRHIRDGLVENQRSKATLHLLIQELQKTEPELIYFPSYEILMDDLRDYRFYEANLTHPNTLAIQYIWEKFDQMFFTQETRSALKYFTRLRAALNHKVQHPGSESHRQFLQTTLQLIEDLEQQFPYAPLSPLRTRLQNQLKSYFPSSASTNT
jgi:hypothetical protein